MLKQFQFLGDKNKNSKQASERELLVPLIPTSGVIMGSYVNSSMDLHKGKNLSAMMSVVNGSRLILLVDRLNDSAKEITTGDIRFVGTLCDVKGMMRFTRDVTRVSVEGKSRAVIKEIVSREPFLMAKVEVIDCDSKEYSPEELSLYSLLKDKYFSLLSILGKLDDSQENVLELKKPDDGCDYIAAFSPLSETDFYRVLECTDVNRRLQMLIEFIDVALRTSQLEVEIESRIAANFAEEQKSRYLREKRDLIDKELNGDDDVVTTYRTKLEALPIEDEYKTKLLKELDRLEGTPLNSQEASVSMSYFDCVLDLPWDNEINTEFDITEADKILDEDHYGLEKVKTRISEYLAVLKLTKEMKSPILCLAGPPGVGKTSIAKSIARATGRKFTRLSLGGMHDEAEIRGHRKTYVGAMPGRIIAGLRQVQSKNTVFLLDEIDKLANDYKGDPSSALLEVLDPEQNSTFMDNYVEIPFDLSQVMFITTANSLSSIPDPLLDRLEIIEIDGYLPDEKLEIAKQHLVKKQMKLNGVTEDDITITDDILNELITEYTAEAGVRQLERNIASLCRKAAKNVVENKGKLELSSDKLREYLGAKAHNFDIAEDESLVGVVNGLAWTAAGGTTLQIEVAVSEGTGKLELTGHLGDVMKESAKAAIGYLKANAKTYGIDPESWDKTDIHIHVPEGAVPKDGPSAGVTMATALYSAITKTPVHQKLAMTGEITLTGRVLAIGGLREKLLAATRAKIDRVIIPKQNEGDLIEVPEKIKSMLTIAFAEKIDDVYKFVFGENYADKKC